VLGIYIFFYFLLYIFQISKFVPSNISTLVNFYNLISALNSVSVNLRKFKLFNHYTVLSLYIFKIKGKQLYRRFESVGAIIII